MNKLRVPIALLISAALGPFAMAMPSSAAASQTGYWKLVDTIMYGSDRAVTQSIDWEFDDGIYPKSRSGELGDINLTQSFVGSASPAVDPWMISVDFKWPTPPATAKPGVKIPTKIVATVVDQESIVGNVTWNYRIDHADVAPGMWSGWNYDGIALGGYGATTYQGNLIFPTYDATADWASGGRKIRLQAEMRVESNAFAVQYVYEFVKTKVKYQIVCVMKKKTVKKTTYTPKCPKGYKLKSKKVVG